MTVCIVIDTDACNSTWPLPIYLDTVYTYSLEKYFCFCFTHNPLMLTHEVYLKRELASFISWSWSRIAYTVTGNACIFQQVSILSRMHSAACQPYWGGFCLLGRVCLLGGSAYEGGICPHPWKKHGGPGSQIGSDIIPPREQNDRCV